MKILQISNYYYPHIGGIEQVAKDISDSLSDIGNIEQKIICFNEDASDGNYNYKRNSTADNLINGIEVIRCRCFAKISSQSLSLVYFSRLKDIMRRFNPDIIIFHYPNPFVATLLIPVLPKKTKFIIWWHLDIIKQKFLRVFFSSQNKKLCERADKIIATSPNYINGSRLLSLYKEKCIVIPNCIRIERFVEDQNVENKIKKIKDKYYGKTICFTIGRHVPYKGIEYLIRASKYLDNSYAIIIGGKGELTDSLIELSRNDKKIEFIGRVSDSDLLAFYKACDIYCFPSITKNEAFGISLAEGMYFGKPAITFNIPGSGVNYVNLNCITGLECNNKDSMSFAQAIMKLGNNRQLLQKYGEAANRRVVNNFMFVQFKEAVVNLVNNI